MADTPIASTTRNNTHDLTNLYKSVRFQQGRPVLDTELNDLQDISFEQVIAEIRNSVRFSGIETSPFEWAVLPLGDDPDSIRNVDNFGVTIGRLPTLNGTVDTGSISDKRIPYDYQKLVTNNDAFTTESFGNYMFKGNVSSVDPTTPAIKFRDFSKHFKSEHKLLASTTAIDFSASGNADLIFNVKTESCRIVFTSATNQANLGLIRNLVAHTTDEITLDVALPSAILAGDEYVIIPENALENKRALYDLADAENTILGSEANPLQVAFVQTWDEDISSNEDNNIEHAPIGQETTHRSQLRWCVRVVDIFSLGIERFASHYNVAKWLHPAGTDPAGMKVYEGAESIKDLLFELIDSQEVAIASNQLGSVTDFTKGYSTIGDGTTLTFKDKELVRSNGIIGYNYQDSTQNDISRNILEITANSDTDFGVPAIQGTQLISQSIMKGLGDKGFLDWPTLKALVLTHLFTDKANINRSVDVSILSLWSSPSKRLKLEWLRTGCDFSQANGFAPLGVNNETLNNKFWPNSYMNIDNDIADAIVIPFHGGLPKDTTNTYGSQVSVYMTPPRTFLRNSEIATEIARARECFYGTNPLELIEPLRAIYNPTDFVRKVVCEVRYDWMNQGSTFSETTYGSVNQRLDFLENTVRLITGLNTAQKIKDVHGNYGETVINNLPSIGNKIIDADSQFGIGQAGTGSSRELLADLSHDISQVLTGITSYEDGTVQVGGVNYVNPLRNKTPEISLGGKDQVVGKVGPETTIFSREKITLANGTDSYSYTSTDVEHGYSETKGLQNKRELHEGLDTALTFAQAFNFRKLAIKTAATTQGDLYTINVPYWWETKNIDDLFSEVKASLVADPNNAGEFLLPDSFFRNWFDSFNGQAGATSSFFSAIRTHLADVNTTGPMGLTSYNGIGLGSLAEGPLQKALGKDTGTTATNTSLLPFLDKISGSVVATRFDHGSADLDGYTQNTYYDSIDGVSSSKLIDPNKNVWGRRSIGLDAIKTFAQGSSVNNVDGNPINRLPSTGLDSNRCTSLRLRYHVGDFYPGDLDERGVPANLLVDSLNLYVRIEPLPLVHWQTLPKHQHSILEGSMDLSEAIATLMDLANGRGIPDHLFTLGDHYVPASADTGNSFLAQGASTEVLENSVLSIQSMIDGKSSGQTFSYSGGFEDLAEKGLNVYQGPFNTGLMAIGVPVIVPNADPRAQIALSTSGYSLTIEDVQGVTKLLIEAFNPTGNANDAVTDYPKRLSVAEFTDAISDEITGNAIETSLSQRFTNNTNWEESYDIWATSTGNPLSSEGPQVYRDYLNAWISTGITATIFQISGIDANPRVIKHSSNGLLSLTESEAMNLLETGKTNLTLPIISPWLTNAYGSEGSSNEDSALRISVATELHPAMRGTKVPTVNNQASVQFGNGFVPKSILSKFDATTKTRVINHLKSENAASELKDVILQAYTSQTYSTNITRLDPVGICIPNSAQPYVHWYHPNMTGLTAPGGGEGLMMQSTGLDPNNQAVTTSYDNIRYTPYGEWGSDSLIMTGLVPFGGQAERLRQAAGFKAIAGYNSQNVNTAYNSAGLLDNTGENTNITVRDDIMRFLDESGTSPEHLAEAIYKGLFDFTAESFDTNQATSLTGNQLGDETPWHQSWLGMFNDGDQINGVRSLDAYAYPSMLPYFSYSTGFLGLGGIHNQDGTTSPRPSYQGQSVDDALTAKQNQGSFDVWANWFPYLPSALHQNADAMSYNAQQALTLEDRMNKVVFSQTTGPVYLPASRSVYNRTLENNSLGYTTPINDLTADGDRELQHEVVGGEYVHERNVGYHPLLQTIGNDQSRTTESSTAQRIRETLAYPSSDKSSQSIDAMISLLTFNNVSDELLDNPNFLPNVEDNPSAFEGTVLRSGLTTETLGWINLYTKTYNRIYGHKSIHPYAYLDMPETKPKWHKDFANSKGIVSGKGPDKDVDTLYAGDLGTGLYMTKRNTFMDPLCLGIGAVRSTGHLVHDSASDEQNTYVFRDIFDLCSYEREVLLGKIANTNATRENSLQGLVRTSAAWSKMGMQSKLMFNSSIRVLHTRPAGANSTAVSNIDAASKGEINYGATGQMPKSLTEMFLCVDPVTNRLFQAPRPGGIFKATQKPFIQLESLVTDVDNTHPNYTVMKRLKPMVSSNLTGSSTNQDRYSLEVLRDGSFADNMTQFSSQDVRRIGGDNIEEYLNGDKNASVDTTRVGRTDSQINEHKAIDMGDAFTVDPFDLLWESSLPQSVKDSIDRLSAIPNTAQNSGVEYELLSTLARVHTKAQSIGLKNTFNGSNGIGLVDTMPTPNELTLPGDHEIVFVLYTGDYGNEMVADTPCGVNPPVAGCHIKATIEINRPSERYDSQRYSELSDPSRGIHYGQTPLVNRANGNSQDSALGDRQLTGLNTYSVAGGRPSLDLSVYSNDPAGPVKIS